jgi:hypothetical protein
MQAAVEYRPRHVYRPNLYSYKKALPKVKSTPNAEQVRSTVASALRRYGSPLGFGAICMALRTICRFKIRREYVLMSLMCKQQASGIRYTGKGDHMEFGLAEWEELVH